MPNYTNKLKLPIPVGHEYHNRENYTALIQAIEEGAEAAIYRGTEAPADTNKLWLNTTEEPNTLHRYDEVAAAWVAVGGGGPEFIEAKETVTVGAGGDFATLGEALKYFSGKYPLYTHDVDLTEKFMAEIRLLSGFIVDELIHVQGVNLGWIVITSEDAQVQLRSFPASGLGGIRKSTGVFSAERAVFPTIGTIFALDDSATTGVLYALHLYRQSKGRILENCGFTFEAKAGGGGSLYLVGVMDQSMLLGDRAIYTNCLNTALSIADNSIAKVNNSTVTGNGQSMEVGGNSIVHASSANCSGYTTVGIKVAGASLVYLMAAKGQKVATNATGDLTVELGGIVVAHNFTGGISQTKNVLTEKGVIFQP